MFKLIKDFKMLRSPDDAETIESSGKDTLEILNEKEVEQEEVLEIKEEKKVEKKDDEEEEESTEEESEEDSESEDELDELEEELKEPDEEDLELVTPVGRKEILKAYPDLFKKFPYLEKAYYREQAYTQILPTIEDAKTAAEAKGLWENLESEIGSGNLTNLLKSVAQGDKNSFYRIADNFLDTVESIDPQVAQHIYTGVVKQAIQLMADSDDTKEAAAKAYKFFFPGKGWEDHKPLAREETKDPRVEELNTRQRDFVKQQFTTARTEISGKVQNVIKATIEKHIDPKQSMSAYVKSNAIKDTLTEVQEQIGSDARFQKLLNKFWEDAAKKNFDSDSKNRIKAAILSRAKTLLTPAIKKSRQVALAGSVRKVSKDTTVKNPGITTAPKKSGQTIDKDKLRGMSTLDILNS